MNFTNCTLRFFVWLIPNIDLHLSSFHSDSTSCCHYVLVACASPAVSEHVTIKELCSENSFHNHRAESQVIECTHSYKKCVSKHQILI